MTQLHKFPVSFDTFTSQWFGVTNAPLLNFFFKDDFDFVPKNFISLESHSYPVDVKYGVTVNR